MGKPAEAVAPLQEALSIALPSDDDPVALASTLALVGALCRTEQLGDGVGFVAVAQGLAGALRDRAGLAQARVGRACLAFADRDVEGALAFLAEAQALQTEVTGAASLPVAHIIEIEAKCLLETGRQDRAVAPRQQAASIREALLGPHHPATRRTQDTSSP